MFLPMIAVCGPAYCLAWNAAPVATFAECERVVIEQRETVRALVHEGWIYSYACVSG